MKALSKFFTRIFATYLFEKMLAKDIEQYNIRMEYLEDMLIEQSNPDIPIERYDLIKTEINTIKYRRDRMAKMKAESDKMRQILAKGV